MPAAGVRCFPCLGGVGIVHASLLQFALLFDAAGHVLLNAALV